MGRTDIWPTVHAERKALSADLRTVGQDRWVTESLCAGWSVRDVLAHMTAAALMTPPSFFARLAASGFSFNSTTVASLDSMLVTRNLQSRPSMRI